VGQPISPGDFLTEPLRKSSGQALKRRGGGKGITDCGKTKKELREKLVERRKKITQPKRKHMRGTGVISRKVIVNQKHVGGNKKGTWRRTGKRKQTVGIGRVNGERKGCQLKNRGGQKNNRK